MKRNNKTRDGCALVTIITKVPSRLLCSCHYRESANRWSESAIGTRQPIAFRLHSDSIGLDVLPV
jgi:hypothetical protein